MNNLGNICSTDKAKGIRFLKFSYNFPKALAQYKHGQRAQTMFYRKKDTNVFFKHKNVSLPSELEKCDTTKEYLLYRWTGGNVFKCW